MALLRPGRTAGIATTGGLRTALAGPEPAGMGRRRARLGRSPSKSQPRRRHMMSRSLTVPNEDTMETGTDRWRA